MSRFVFKKNVESYTLFSRFGQGKGEKFELRLASTEGEWLAFLNFCHGEAAPLENYRNSHGIPELFVSPEQYLGTINLLRHEAPVWFTLYEEPLSGWLSTNEVPKY